MAIMTKKQIKIQGLIEMHTALIDLKSLVNMDFTVNLIVLKHLNGLRLLNNV